MSNILTLDVRQHVFVRPAPYSPIYSCPSPTRSRFSVVRPSIDRGESERESGEHNFQGDSAQEPIPHRLRHGPARRPESFCVAGDVLQRIRRPVQVAIDGGPRGGRRGRRADGCPRREPSLVTLHGQHTGWGKEGWKGERKGEDGRKGEEMK